MRCSACSETVEASSRFCRWCGAPVSDDAAVRGATADRRFATILFADIVDSTVMVRGLEPEHALERLSPILEAMKRTVMEHGGTVCRDQGDGIMASFGAPLSDDRHAVNACLAALALLDRAEAAIPFSTACRVGIHSGLIVGHLAATSAGPAYSVSGEVVHLAARLEANARVGTVLISEATRQLIDGQFVVAERHLKNLKGFDQEITAFELQAPVRQAWFGLHAGHSGMAFHGREAEIARLRDAYNDPRSGAAVISGDPAIGKSRLTREFVEKCVPHDADIHVVVCVQNLSHTPFAAVRRLLLLLLGLQIDASAEQVELGLLARLRKAGRDAVVDDAALRFLLGLPGADRQWAELEPPARFRRIAVAVVDLMSRRPAERARVVLLVEDLHWVDSASMALLGELSKRLRADRFFLLATTRELDGAAGRLLSGLSPVHLRLAPLSKQACEGILEGLVGHSQTLLRLKGRLLDLGGGTPLFLQHLVRWLVDHRALVGAPGNYRLAVHADQLELPASLQAAILWRADRLPGQARQVLSVSAVLQHGITGSSVSQMCGISVLQSQSELDLLVDQGLLVQEFVSGEPSFAFRHALLREAVYDVLVDERRVELHALALRSLEAMPADERGYREGLMSLHAYASHDWPAVAKYARIVGDRAIASSAYREAAAHFEHAVDALYRLPRDRALLEAAIDVRLQARICYSAMAKHDLCLAHISRAHELATELGDTNRALACSIFRVGVLNFIGPIREAQEVGAEALRRAEAAGSVPHIAVAGLALGQAYYVSGSYQDAIAAFSAGARVLVGEKALLRLGTTGTAAAMCASLQAASHVWLGDFADAAMLVARAGDIANQTGRPYDMVSHRYAEGFLLANQGEWHEAITAYERGLDLCRVNDIETYVTTIAGQLGFAYIQAGRAADAVGLMEPALEEALSLRNLAPVAMLKRHLGLAALHRDDLARAERYASEAIDLAGAGGFRMTLAIALHLQAMIALRRGGSHLPEGLRAVEKAAALAETLGIRPTLAAVRLTRDQLSAAANGVGRLGARNEQTQIVGAGQRGKT